MGTRVVSVEIFEVEDGVDVYDIEVDEDESFIVHGVVLHNSAICRSRNGLVIPVTDQAAIAANKPSLHGRCRSTLSPVLSGSINPTHGEWAADPDRQLANRKLEPLPKGWNT
jgi:hypothetical protein